MNKKRKDYQKPLLTEHGKIGDLTKKSKNSGDGPSLAYPIS